MTDTFNAHNFRNVHGGSHADAGAYLPSPEEIAAKCEELRAKAVPELVGKNRHLQGHFKPGTQRRRKVFQRLAYYQAQLALVQAGRQSAKLIGVVEFEQ